MLNRVFGPLVRLAVACLVWAVCAFIPSGAQADDYAVGFRVLNFTDHGRAYGDDLGRPVSVLLWYPAQAGTGEAMAWDDYIVHATDNSMETRETVFGLMQSLKQDWNDRAGVSAIQVPTRRDAEVAPGRYPLVIYSPGSAIEGFDNSPLFEALAARGYVVAAVPSTGYLNRERVFKAPGLSEIVQDLEFGLNVAAQLDWVETDRLAAMGWSWGAMAANVLAMKNPNVDALVNLDSAIAFNEPIAAAHPFYMTDRMRLPVFVGVSALTRDAMQNLLSRMPFADAVMLHFDGMRHGDFMSFPSLARSVMRDLPIESVVRQDSYKTLLIEVPRFLDAALSGDFDVEAYANGVTGLGAAKVDVTARKGLAPPPLHGDFLALVQEQGAAAARSQWEAANQLVPGLELIDMIDGLNFSYELFTGGDQDEGIAFLELVSDMYPNSYEPLGLLGEYYMDTGEKDLARARFEQGLAILAGMGFSPAVANAMQRYRAAIEALTP